MMMELALLGLLVAGVGVIAYWQGRVDERMRALETVVRMAERCE